jgi:hypothetical protein
MYRWYKNAKVCYAYLGDVTAAQNVQEANWASLFARSKWFKRGWTLQELIARGM